MTTNAAVTTWIDAYVAAWNSNAEHDVAALFADDATYATEPYSPPWLGRDEIVARWLDRQDRPGETTFTWEPVVVAGDTAVIQGTTTYPDQTYSNLWVLQFDTDGRCRAFTEWWMAHPRP